MKRYELSEGSSNKFWEIEVSGKKLTLRWGRIGGAPQEKVTTFPSPEKATAAHDKLVAEKTKKGYALAKGGGQPAKTDRPAKADRPGKAGKVAPTTSVRAKGRSHDISTEPVVAVDVSKIEKNLGLPVGPVMRELVELCTATMPSRPSGAFALIAPRGDLDFGCFHSKHKSLENSYKPKPKWLRAFATDHKDVYSFVVGGGTTTDDCPIAYDNVVEVEDEKIIASDLATFLSQLAFDPAVGYTPDDKKDIDRLSKNLKTHSAVSAKRAKAKLSDELEALDLEEDPATAAEDASAPTTTKAGKGGMPSKADLAKAEKLTDKVNDLRWEKPKAALPFAEKALAILEAIPYDSEAGWMRTTAEETVLQLLIEANRTADAKKRWEELAERWSAAGAGGVGWLTVAEVGSKLKTKLPPPLRERVRRAWARGRFSTVYDFDEKTNDAAPSKPSKDHPFRDAQVALMHKKVALARTCLAAARKADADSRNAHDLFEIVILEVEGKHEAAVAEYRKQLAAANSKERAPWEDLAAIAVLFGLDDAATKKAILTPWKKQDEEGAWAIFES